MMQALRTAELDNDELKVMFGAVERTRFECPRGRCSRALLRLKIKLARDIAELTPAPEAIPLPPVDGAEAGFDVPQINAMHL